MVSLLGVLAASFVGLGIATAADRPGHDGTAALAARAVDRQPIERHGGCVARMLACTGPPPTSPPSTSPPSRARRPRARRPRARRPRARRPRARRPRARRPRARRPRARRPRARRPRARRPPLRPTSAWSPLPHRDPARPGWSRAAPDRVGAAGRGPLRSPSSATDRSVTASAPPCSAGAGPSRPTLCCVGRRRSGDQLDRVPSSTG